MQTIIEPQKVIRIDHSAIYEEYEKAIKYIRSELKSIYPYSENTPSIAQGNSLFFHTIIKAKREAFSRITSMVKPYVVYRVNLYYSHHN